MTDPCPDFEMLPNGGLCERYFRVAFTSYIGGFKYKRAKHIHVKIQKPPETQEWIDMLIRSLRSERSMPIRGKSKQG